MNKVVLFGLGIYFFLTGVYLLVAPETFYRLTPGVSAMGPFNYHFIIDVSFAFLISGAALLYGAYYTQRSVLVFGAMWPMLHALFHAWIWIQRGFPFDGVWLADTFGVIVPGIVAMWFSQAGKR